MRRIWKPKGLIRQTDRVYQGTRQECQSLLERIGEATGIEPVLLSLSWRVSTIERTKEIRLSVEETFIVTPNPTFRTSNWHIDYLERRYRDHSNFL